MMAQNLTPPLGFPTPRSVRRGHANAVRARRWRDVTGTPAEHDHGGGNPARVTFEELVALATNLRWTWHMDVRALFQGLFPDVGAGSLEWPLRLLNEAGSTQIDERLAAS